MDDLIEEYFRTLDSATIDCFRSLFYEASDRQLESISEKYESASGLNREVIYDDGVEANMIRWLGDELILISLYHSFEKQLKEIIQYKQSSRNDGQEDIGRLHRWKEMKKHIPTHVKNLNEYQKVNTLRVLVNCLKHAGVVNEELNRLAPSFGNVGDEIDGDLGGLYEEYKACASSVINKTYENNEA